MKKVLCLVLALVLVLGCFAGCGPKEPADWEAKGTPMADPRVRQALNYAIDKQAIVTGIFEGTVNKADALSVPGATQAEGLNDYAYNPEKAKELLKEAQWPADYVIDFATYYNNQEATNIMTAIQSMWEAVGVKSRLRLVEGDLASQLWVQPKDKVNGPAEVTWDVLYAGINAPVEAEFYHRFGSEAAMNSHTPKNDTVDTLIKETITANVADQTAAFHKLQKELNANANYIPLIHVSAFIFKSDRLDMHGAKLGNDQFTYDNNVINWTTTNADGRIYTNAGPMENYQYTFVNPGLYPHQDYVFDRLVSANENLVADKGLLAESYKVSKDGMEIEFVLREGVKWHDGQAFDAEDVRFTIEYGAKVPGASAIMLGTYKAIEGAQDYIDGKADLMSGIVIDGNKVTIKFAKVDPNAMVTFSQWPILPEHLLKDSNPLTAQQDKFWQAPIGTGPFKVKETVLNNYGLLERNEDYFLESTGNVKEIYMHSSNDSDPNLVKNATAGKIDYAWSKATTDAKAIKGLAGMTADTISITFTRLMYINQYPHPSNVK